MFFFARLRNSPAANTICLYENRVTVKNAKQLSTKMLTLREIIETTIVDLERTILMCEQELEGDYALDTIYRKIFRRITGQSKTVSESFYYKNEQPFQQLRKKALRIDEKRNKQYHEIARKHLNVADMIEKFRAASTPLSHLYAEQLARGRRISVAILFTYSSLLMTSYKSDKGLKAMIDIDTEQYNSKERKQSVRKEMKLYSNYIAQCREELLHL